MACDPMFTRALILLIVGTRMDHRPPPPMPPVPPVPYYRRTGYVAPPAKEKYVKPPRPAHVPNTRQDWIDSAINVVILAGLIGCCWLGWLGFIIFVAASVATWTWVNWQRSSTR